MLLSLAPSGSYIQSGAATVRVMAHRVESLTEEAERRRRVECVAARQALVEQSARNPRFEVYPCNQCGIPTARCCGACGVRRSIGVRLTGHDGAGPTGHLPHVRALCRNCEDDASLRCCRTCFDVFGDVDGPPRAQGDGLHPLDSDLSGTLPVHIAWSLLHELEARQGPLTDGHSPGDLGHVADPRAAPAASPRPAGMPPVAVPHFRTVAQRGIPAPGTWVNVTMVHDTEAVGCPHVVGFVFWNESAARWERFAAIARSDCSHNHHVQARTAAAGQANEGPWNVHPVARAQRRREVAAATASAWQATPATAPVGTDQEARSIPPLAITQRRRQVAAAAAAVRRPPTASAPGGTWYIDAAALAPWWPEPTEPAPGDGYVWALDRSDPWRDSYAWVPASSFPPPPDDPPHC